jgi:hypothetical protein
MKTFALVSALALFGGAAAAQELENPYPADEGYTVPPEEGTQVDPSDEGYGDDLATPDDADGDAAEAAPFES